MAAVTSWQDLPFWARYYIVGTWLCTLYCVWFVNRVFVTGSTDGWAGLALLSANTALLLIYIRAEVGSFKVLSRRLLWVVVGPLTACACLLVVASALIVLRIGA